MFTNRIPGNIKMSAALKIAFLDDFLSTENVKWVK